MEPEATQAQVPEVTLALEVTPELTLAQVLEELMEAHLYLENNSRKNNSDI